MESVRRGSKKPNAPDFRRYLQEVLVERCRVNPNYSLRSFARSLQVEPSALSQIINGKRPITRKMQLRLGTALGLSLQELKNLPIHYHDATPRAAIPPYQQLTLDAFAVISEWYHYAILELTYTHGFRADPSWIARRLGITKSEVNIAIERLQRLELLKTLPNGSWADASENGTLTHLTPAVSSDAARKYQVQLLELSKRAVQEISLSRRNHTSATFCFDPDDFPRAVEQIAEFRRQFSRDFQPKRAAREVYQLQVSFFPLTQATQKKENRDEK